MHLVQKLTILSLASFLAACHIALPLARATCINSIFSHEAPLYNCGIFDRNVVVDIEGECNCEVYLHTDYTFADLNDAVGTDLTQHWWSEHKLECEPIMFLRLEH